MEAIYMIGKTSDVIRKCRLAEGISQERLATLSGLNRSAISQYENKDICPSVYRFEDILNALGYELIIQKKGK